ncbi:hypothetical protein HMPREF3216_00290 [Gardnerella vaginalis]|uniref:Uncharacterized protein n=1 Tax=Gardnerella vaginalis TaxID=2702 RepID=A0A133NRE3_GARVA|nr:hypothetical protein HMPREF3216_00290 [Gardnerella vaginalis]
MLLKTACRATKSGRFSRKCSSKQQNQQQNRENLTQQQAL